MSSAQIRQLGCRFSGFALSLAQFNFSGRSDMYILNKSGLSMHPCLTPWFISKRSVTLLFILTHALSFVYMFLIVLKKLSFMSYVVTQ